MAGWRAHSACPDDFVATSLRRSPELSVPPRRTLWQVGRNHTYVHQPALFQRDAKAEGFRWIDASDAETNVFSFLRFAETGSPLACVANLSPVPRQDYRVGLPVGGAWKELLNTDDLDFGGSGVSNGGQVWANDAGCHGFPCSADLTLPPLAVVWFIPEEP